MTEREGARFTRAQRIRRTADFQRIQASGARISTPHLVLLLARGADGPEPVVARLGVVASRKVGGAVARNRAKRLVREAFRLGADVFPPGIDCVVIVRAGLDRLSLAGVQAELRTAERVLVRKAAELLQAPIPTRAASPAR